MKYFKLLVISSYTFAVIPWFFITNLTHTKEKYKCKDYEMFYHLL